MRTTSRLSRALLLGPVLLLAACGTQQPGAAPAPAPAAAASATLPAAPAPAAPAAARPVVASTPPHVTKVLTVLMENHGTQSATAGMPQLAALARTYGHTTRYRAVTHPSLPNYLALAGGSTASVTDDRSPSSHPLHGSTVFDVALARGHSARVYAEGMPRRCGPSPSGRYAVKHNPWAYYRDATPARQCAANDLPLGTSQTGALHDDVARGSLPDVGMVVPDLCHDAHDCSLATADRWLAGWVKAVQAGPDWKAGRLAVVVTFDESETNRDNTVLTVVATPSLHGATSGAALTHYSWTRWMTDLVGAPALRNGASATSLGKAFGL
ncbi:MAG: Phosphoesterase family protein [Frankiales bacterium]|nr:Phosphoesterase family protein [Frankiales bacterium]